MNETKWPKFRLKMDTPDHRAGEIFWRTDNWMICDDEDLEEGRAFKLDNVDDFDEWFEEVQESGWWKPSRGDSYYFINGAGVITSTVWMDNSQDRVRYLMGNCFRTTEAADRFANYLKAVATVRQDEGVLMPEQINELERIAGDAYCIAYTDNQNDEEEVLCRRTVDLSNAWAPVGAILFDTEKHADASRRKHQDEWKVIASYDWSRE